MASEASEASEESEDFEASDAYEESVQKGRETTELLTVWPLQVVCEAKGCQGHQLETVRCQSHGVRKPWEVHVMASLATPQIASASLQVLT